MNLDSHLTTQTKINLNKQYTLWQTQKYKASKRKYFHFYNLNTGQHFLDWGKGSNNHKRKCEYIKPQVKNYLPKVTINKMNSQPQTGRKYAQNIDLNKRLANKNCQRI